MFAIFNSRNFGLRIEGIDESFRNALVPIADIANHESPSRSHWTYDNYGDLGSGFYARSVGGTKKGDQFYLSYGENKIANVIFESYGFILPGNSIKAYSFTMGRKYTNTDGSDKMSEFQYDVTTNFYSDTMRELFYFYRAMLSGDSKLLKLDKESTTIVRISSFSIENETAVVDRIRAISRVALDSYPRSLAEDQELLNRDDLTLNQRNCLLITSMEKEVLETLIKNTTTVLGFLAMDKEDAIVHILSNRTKEKTKKRVYKYLKEDLLPVL